MPATAPIPVSTTYGAIFMAALLTTGVWSIAMVQMSTYFWKFPKDHPGLKLLVGSIGTICSVQLGLILAGAWRSLIAQFGDFTGLINVPIVDIIQYLPILYSSICVQGFFVWRIVKLTEKTWIVVVPWLVSAMVQIVGGLVWVVFAIESPTLVTLVHDKTWTPGSISLTTAAITDIVLAVVTTSLLASRMADAAYRPSVRTLRRLIILSINSGTWTAAFAICDSVLYWAYRDNMLYVIFDCPVGPMYLCTLLANLNARKSSRPDFDTDYYVESGPSATPKASAGKVIAVGQLSTPETEMSFFKPSSSSPHFQSFC